MQMLSALKNTASLMNKNCVNRSGLDLFKEVLWVALGQRTAKLQAIKVGDLKKPAAQPESNQTWAACLSTRGTKFIFESVS